jgi:5-methylcytosine-specific restriction endonuclease McrA
MPTIPKPQRKAYLPKREVQGRRIHANTPFYQSQQWRRVRKTYLEAHPLCVECQAKGVITPATIVDHIKPINIGGARFDFNNLQGLCDSCHNKKSGREAHKRSCEG